MDPLHPDLRRQLKQAHPGLTDAEIDSVEELLAKRFTLDPQRDAEALRALDDEKDELLARLMPHFGEVYQTFHAARRQESAPRQGAQFRVERKEK